MTTRWGSHERGQEGSEMAVDVRADGGKWIDQWDVELNGRWEQMGPRGTAY